MSLSLGLPGAPAWLRLAGLAAALAFAGTGALAWSSRVDTPAHARYRQAVERARELDSRLVADVAAARLGVVTHFDDVVRTWAATRETLAALDAPPADLPADDRAILAERAAALREVVAARGRALEGFKTDQAVLRNSLRALPALVDRLGDPSPRPLRLASDRVLAFAVDPGPGRAAAARCALAAFDPNVREPGCAAEPAAPPTDPVGLALLAHARVVVDYAPRLDGAVTELMTLPVGEAVAALADAYTVAHAAAVERARDRRSLVAVTGATAALFGALAVIAHLAATARALREASGRLGAALTDLQVERDRVVELADLRSRFVAITSHEFRTPLAVILSSADLLAAYGGTWPEERRLRHTDRIRDTARDMLRMLDRILVIGRAEAGMLEHRPRRLALGELLTAVAEEVRLAAGADRTIAIDDQTPGAEVVLDDALVRHVVSNLLANAVKYSPDDSTVHLRFAAAPREVWIQVADEGIGIPAAERPHLFDPFRRGSNATGFRGTGLGLAVVKRALDVQGGTIGVESEVGRGTTVEVRIPTTEEAG